MLKIDFPFSQHFRMSFERMIPISMHWIALKSAYYRSVRFSQVRRTETDFLEMSNINCSCLPLTAEYDLIFKNKLLPVWLNKFVPSPSLKQRILEQQYNETDKHQTAWFELLDRIGSDWISCIAFYLKRIQWNGKNCVHSCNSFTEFAKFHAIPIIWDLLNISF